MEIKPGGDEAVRDLHVKVVLGDETSFLCMCVNLAVIQQRS